MSAAAPPEWPPDEGAIARRRSGSAQPCRDAFRSLARGDALQIRPQVGGRLIAGVAILVEEADRRIRATLADGRIPLLRPGRAPGSVWRRRAAGGARRVERALAGGHLVDNQAEGKLVRRGIQVLSFRLLRAHVGEVPTACPVGYAWHLSARWRTAACLASPKSRIFTRPSRVTRMFAGFRSRWTIPAPCAATGHRQSARDVEKFSGIRPAQPECRRRTPSPGNRTDVVQVTDVRDVQRGHCVRFAFERSKTVPWEP